jgi:tyrosine-protein kinase Etk/Wzc
MGELLATAAAQYDLVVIDSPPVLVGADTDGLAAHLGVEVVLVVTPSTKRRALTRTLRRLELIEASIAGIVVNRDGRLPSKYRYY